MVTCLGSLSTPETTPGQLRTPLEEKNGHLAASSDHAEPDTGAVEDINETTRDDLPESSEHAKDDTGTDEDLTGNTNGHIRRTIEHTTEAEVRVLQTKVDGLEALVDLYRERLSDADWRYQEILQQLKASTGAAALPAAQAAEPRNKRWWWPFG